MAALATFPSQERCHQAHSVLLLTKFCGSCDPSRLVTLLFKLHELIRSANLAYCGYLELELVPPLPPPPPRRTNKKVSAREGI